MVEDNLEKIRKDIRKKEKRKKGKKKKANQNDDKLKVNSKPETLTITMWAYFTLESILSSS